MMPSPSSIAVRTKERSNQLPDIPSIFEAGFGEHLANYGLATFGSIDRA